MCGVLTSSQTNDDPSTTKGEDPNGDGCILSHGLAGAPDLVDGSKWSNGVRNVVRSVSERSRAGGHDL